MGLFSSSTETYVGTSVSRAIPDKLLPNAIRSGGLRALVRGTDTTDTVTDELFGSLAVKAKRMYEYGKTKYTHGLPSGQFAAAIDGQAEVTAVLESLGGVNVVLTYSHYRPPNMQHIGWMRLVSQQGYDPVTNILGNLSASLGRTAYLDNVTLVIPADTYATYTASALEQWGVPAKAGYSPTRKSTATFNPFVKQTPIEKVAGSGSPYIKVDYVWEVPSTLAAVEGYIPPPTLHEASFNISVDGYDLAADYYQVCYQDGAAIKYWMYKAGSGTYPTLDWVFNPPAAIEGTYFPFAYFRYNKISEATNKTTAAYKTSKKLVSYLGMQYDTIADAINASPNIADVEQAMLIMAVPANSTDPIELRYLFTFFDNLFASNLNQYSSPAELKLIQMQVGNLDITRSSILIQDKRFKMALSNAGITKRKRAGSIGKVGKHTFELQTVTVDRQVTNGDTLITETYQVPFKVHVYRKQISTVVYEELQVVDLQMIYHIFQQYTYVGGAGSSALLVPLDSSICDTYSLPDREMIFGRSLHYIFNSKVDIQLSWYQQDWFQGVIFVAAVVFTAISWGADGGSVLMAAIASGGAAAITFEVLVLIGNFLINLAIAAVLKRVVKAIGIDLAILIVIIAIAYGVYDFSANGGLPGAPWAKDLLSLASGFARAIASNTSDLMNQLNSDYNSLMLLEQSATDSLTQANKLLENINWLSPIVIFGEQPEDFYNRTVHSGNIGVITLGAISSYVDIALTLPKLNETLGEFT